MLLETSGEITPERIKRQSQNKTTTSCPCDCDGEKWRNSSRKNKETEPKQTQQPVVDVTGDGSKV